LVSYFNGGTQTKGFGNRMLRRIFGQKRDEVKGSWRKLHNEELHNLYSLPSKIKMNQAKKD
jgi:hypothetical protein